MSSAQLSPEQSLLPTRSDNSRALLVVLVIMSMLAGLALLFSRGADRLSDGWQTQLAGTATVQIIYPNADTRAGQMETALRTLETAFGETATIEAQSETAARDLLSPWLGNTPLPADIPIPGLISIESGTPINTGELQALLEAEGLRAKVDDHTRYADGLRGTARQLVALGSSLLLLLLIAGLAVNIFATTAGLSAQKEIIRVLVQVGATDGFIARLFVTQAGKRGAIGAAIGMGLAALIWILISASGRFELTWTGAGMGILDVVWLILLGLVFALICAGAAGVTSIRQLRFERRRM